MIYPAIIVIAYNRANSLKRLLHALENAKYDYCNIKLIISIDGGGSKEVVEIAERFKWNYGQKEVIEHEYNLGLRQHVLACGDMSIKYESIIIFEDDVYPSPFFYEYAVKALNYYIRDDKVFAISLYSINWVGYCKAEFIPFYDGYDIYYAQMESSWGQCLIGDRWKKFREWYKEKEGKLEYNKEIPLEIQKWKNSYSKYIAYYLIDKDLYYITPYISLSTNFSDIGTHVKKLSSSYQVSLLQGKKEYNFPQYENAQKYTIFYNNINVAQHISEILSINKEDICLDYYGVRKDYSGYKYCLTTKHLNYKRIKSYGIVMRPWEQNIYNDIDGNDIVIYDLENKQINKRYILSSILNVEYDIKELPVKKAIVYTFLFKPYVNFNKLLAKIIKRVKRKK